MDKKVRLSKLTSYFWRALSVQLRNYRLTFDARRPLSLGLRTYMCTILQPQAPREWDTQTLTLLLSESGAHLPIASAAHNDRVVCAESQLKLESKFARGAGAREEGVRFVESYTTVTPPRVDCS